MIKQTKWLLRGAGPSAAMLMLAASVALAGPREYGLVDPNTLPPVELSTPPKPDADFFSSPEVFAGFAARRSLNSTPAVPTSRKASERGGHVDN